MRKRHGPSCPEQLSTVFGFPLAALIRAHGHSLNCRKLNRKHYQCRRRNLLTQQCRPMQSNSHESVPCSSSPGRFRHSRNRNSEFKFTYSHPCSFCCGPTIFYTCKILQGNPKSELITMESIGRALKLRLPSTKPT